MDPHPGAAKLRLAALQRECGTSQAAMLWSMLLTICAIRGLTQLSGICSDNGEDKYTWMFSASSVTKPWFLSYFCAMCDPCRRLLGYYHDESYDEAMRLAQEPRPFRFGEAPRYISWRDLTVRLGYILVFDNLIHVVWLRYFYDGPYTAYVSNSELLTVLLVVRMCVYGIAKVQTLLECQDDDVEVGVATDQKSRDLEDKGAGLPDICRGYYDGIPSS
ncbi:hypothetical protein BDV95DRAFT_619944 [Massariosphaeria phaeospora]|uniref:Uncharacterized protein n=1 Tax=Massariosphaeria phaeospora TaxID=100035 RepID=A0A7C8I7K1_9PLEO|nr:hypothetical protein BDV95DRAFT_619944 [Massariosphaeria phaeospora]